MSNYSYKNIPINQITDQTGGSQNQNSYNNFLTKASNTTATIPLPLPYYINNTSISNLCTAASQIINTTTNISVPSGANQMRAIIVGAGGGDGGYGGSASLNISTVGNFLCQGGSGGTGGSGGIYYYDETSVGVIDISNAGNISITCGTAGTNGSNGNGANRNTNSQNNLNEVANAGSSGNSGLFTSITVLGTSYTANGGGGGGGGSGGHVTYNIPSGGNCVGYYNGGTGTSGTGNTTNNLTYPINTYPNAGTNGYVQIIWLYS